MFDLKLISDIKYIIDTSENGIIVDDVVINNKKELEKNKEKNLKTSREMDLELAEWICNRYITKSKKNKFMIGGKESWQTFKDINVIKF